MKITAMDATSLSRLSNLCLIAQSEANAMTAAESWENTPRTRFVRAAAELYHLISSGEVTPADAP